MKVYVFVKACERRALDSKRYKRYFSENNHEVVDFPEDAELIIYVTCAVFNSDVDYALKKIKEFQKYDAELIVAGCLPKINKEELSEIFNGRTISTKDIEKIDDFFPENKIKFRNIEDANIFSSDVMFDDVHISSISDLIKQICSKIKLLEEIQIKIKYHVLDHLLGEQSLLYKFIIKPKNPRYYIRISRGCMGNCSYCGIKNAIGKHSSKPLEECLSEFKKGLKQGYTHFVLTADDTGAYGIDIGNTFPDLLDELLKYQGNYVIEPQGLNPVWIVKYIDQLEKQLKLGKIKTILSPIQSGSSRILQLMQRYHNTEQMKEIFLRLKKAYPDLNLHMHYIMGFPTETMKDVDLTLNFIKDAGFDGGYIFSYSCKSGSKAEKIEPKISQEEIKKRMYYVKKFLKKAGYRVIYLSEMHFFIFEKRK